jgi:hypothetical protein
MAANRMAAPESSADLGHRTVGDVPGRGTEVARRGGCGVPRRRREQRRVPVHGVARHLSRRCACAPSAGQLLR